MTTLFIILCIILNCLIGNFLIKKGIKKFGKEDYLYGNGGFIYVGWVVLSTVGLIGFGIYNL